MYKTVWNSLLVAVCWVTRSQKETFRTPLHLNLKLHLTSTTHHVFLQIYRQTSQQSESPICQF